MDNLYEYILSISFIMTFVVINTESKVLNFLLMGIGYLGMGVGAYMLATQVPLALLIHFFLCASAWFYNQVPFKHVAIGFLIGLVLYL